MNLTEARERLHKAIAKAVAEHGAPNTFSFGELHAYHGGPPPMIAGRAAKTMSESWKQLAGVTFEAGRVAVKGK